jgi:hypothetical protein
VRRVLNRWATATAGGTLKGLTPASKPTSDDLYRALAPAAARWDSSVTPLHPGFAEARAAAHCAAQLVAAAGATLGQHRADDSHTSLEWRDGPQALAGVTISRADRAARAALRPVDLSLQVWDGTGQVAALSLERRTMSDALDWLADALARALDLATAPLARPQQPLSAHPVARGGPFDPVDRDAGAQLAGWFAGADRLLQALAAAVPEASAVRCWPHHLDIATLIALDPAGTPAATARSVGVGLSPGDASYDQPYWYVTPWPYPRTEQLPALALGHWHTHGWAGAVLPAAAITGGDEIAAFLAAAVASGRRLLTS